MNELPVIIANTTTSVYSVLRTNESSEIIVVLLPAATGTREGPQRIYVEIARELLNLNIASMCCDLPPNGDSIDEQPVHRQGTYKEYLISYYSKYLDLILDFLDVNHRFKEIVLLSISVGCIPVLEYAKKHEISRVILLSPNSLEGITTTVNKSNLKAYYLKLANWETWKKLVSFRINYKKVYTNLFGSLARVTAAGKLTPSETSIKQPINVFCIYGAKDSALKRCEEFWTALSVRNPLIHYRQVIIKNADHSFLGWSLKRSVCREIIEWLKFKQL